MTKLKKGEWQLFFIITSVLFFVTASQVSFGHDVMDFFTDYFIKKYIYTGFPAGREIGKKSGILFSVGRSGKCWEKVGKREICPLNI